MRQVRNCFMAAGLAWAALCSGGAQAQFWDKPGFHHAPPRPIFVPPPPVYYAPPRPLFYAPPIYRAPRAFYGHPRHFYGPPRHFQGHPWHFQDHRRHW